MEAIGIFGSVTAAMTVIRSPQAYSLRNCDGSRPYKALFAGNDFVDWKVAAARQCLAAQTIMKTMFTHDVWNSVLAPSACECRKNTSTSLLLRGYLSTFYVRMMQQALVTDVHERADSLVRSGSSDTTQLSDSEPRPEQTRTSNLTEPREPATILRDYWSSYINTDESLLISGRGRAMSTISQTADLSLGDRGALDLTHKARKALRDRIKQREDWWQRTRTPNPDVCDAQETIEKRHGVWMVVTPDDVRAPFGEKEVYDKVYRGCGCFDGSGIDQ